VKDTVAFLTCPDCGEKYEGLVRPEPGKSVCYECKHVFAEEGQDIPLAMWKEEPVDAIVCDRCGKLVQCTPGNMGTLTSFLPRAAHVLMCPRCRDRLKDRPNWISHHAVAVKYRGRWYKPELFLRSEDKSAIR
jgi:Zn ribbon nucleic-acid-binding protein